MQDHKSDDHFDDSYHASGGMNLGRWFIVALVFVGAFFVIRKVGGAASLAAWGSDWDKGLETASQSGKPMLVLFTADWCPPCQSLKKEVLADSEVSAYLKSQFALVKVDLTERGGPNTETAQTYGIRGVPTLIVFDSKGRQVDRMSGAGPKDHMMQWFRAMESKAAR